MFEACSLVILVRDFHIGNFWFKICVQCVHSIGFVVGFQDLVIICTSLANSFYVFGLEAGRIFLFQIGFAELILHVDCCCECHCWCC